MSEIPSNPNEASQRTPQSKEVELSLEEASFELKEYNIGEAPEGGFLSPGNMETGSLEEIERFYGDDPSRLNKSISGNNHVPYSFLFQEGGSLYGNYTTSEGQDEFMDSDLAITKEAFSPPAWAKELQDFIKLKNPKIFTLDSKVACIRSLTIKQGKPVLTLGAGLYSDSFYSNGSEGVKISLSQQERERLLQNLPNQKVEDVARRAAELEATYGPDRTLRDIILSRYGYLPEFGEHIYNNSIGVAGMVLTKDGEFVFAKRSSQVSINRGINCTASGAAEFDEATLSRYGLQQFLGSEIARETNEELGIKAGALIIGSMKKRIELELGVHEGDYDLVPVGFIRELPRGGKPECMFLIQYKGNTEALVKSIIENPHADKKEIEGAVFSMPLVQAETLVRTKGATSFVQHKGMANLMLCNEYLRNNPGNYE